MKFNVGDKVWCRKYGKGKCRKVDESDNYMAYLFRFYDGTLIWMPKNQTERMVKPAKKYKAD